MMEEQLDIKLQSAIELQRRCSPDGPTAKIPNENMCQRRAHLSVSIPLQQYPRFHFIHFFCRL